MLSVTKGIITVMVVTNFILAQWAATLLLVEAPITTRIALLVGAFITMVLALSTMYPKQRGTGLNVQDY